MRTCKLCGRELPLTEFYKNAQSTGGRLARCKRCIYDQYGADVAARAKRDRFYFQQIKLERGCIDCGYRDHAVALDFDHLPGSTKVYRVAAMAGLRRELIDAEIAKCEVVCANCHRVRTHNRLSGEEI